LYGCETCSLTLREVLRLKRIFGPKREEATGEWRKLHNDELHNLFFSPYYCADQVEEDEMTKTFSMRGT
jgi:hypothetical protein